MFDFTLLHAIHNCITVQTQRRRGLWSLLWRIITLPLWLLFNLQFLRPRLVPACASKAILRVWEMTTFYPSFLAICVGRPNMSGLLMNPTRVSKVNQFSPLSTVMSVSQSVSQSVIDNSGQLWLESTKSLSLTWKKWSPSVSWTIDTNNGPDWEASTVNVNLFSDFFMQ